jgi:hypothetical protein
VFVGEYDFTRGTRNPAYDVIVRVNVDIVVVFVVDVTVVLVPTL